MLSIQEAKAAQSRTQSTESVLPNLFSETNVSRSLGGCCIVTVLGRLLRFTALDRLHGFARVEIELGHSLCLQAFVVRLIVEHLERLEKLRHLKANLFELNFVQVLDCLIVALGGKVENCVKNLLAMLHPAFNERIDVLNSIFSGLD